MTWKNNKRNWALVIFLGLILTLAFIFSGIIYAASSYAGKISIHIEEDYRGGENINIYASLVNHTGKVINTSTYCNVTITHWNGTHLKTDLDNVAMNWTGITGWYYYLWTIPTSPDKGSYGVLVKADPNEIETQATSGFHVAEWAEEIGYLWGQYQRVNTSVIHNETLISVTLSSTSNISIHYNVTIPLKEGYTTSDYLPMRWKFWFIDGNGNCVDQSRGQRFVEPYCNPLVAQIIGLGNSSYGINVTIRPSLTVGNYTMVRELEVDPQQIWVSYGKGEVGKIAVLEDNTAPLADASVEEPKEEAEAITTTLGLGGQCIEILMPVPTTTIKEEKKLPQSKVIGMGAAKEEKGGKLIYFILGLGILSVSVYSGWGFIKKQ